LGFWNLPSGRKHTIASGKPRKAAWMDGKIALNTPWAGKHQPPPYHTYVTRKEKDKGAVRSFF